MKEKLREMLDGAWNLPNMLSVLRLLLVPVFIVVHQLGHTYWALGIFVAASLTDALDGRIARSRHQITMFGKLVDPLADKLMVVSALFCRASAGIFPLWYVFLVLLKELFMVFGSLYALNKGIVVHSRLAGKAAMVMFVVTLILSFFTEAQWYRAASDFAGTQLHVATMYIAAGLMILALVDYVIDTLRVWKKMKETPTQHVN